MIYIQTVVEVTEKDMDNMAETVIADAEITLDDHGLPTSKEMKIAILKEALKKVLEKDLTPEF